MGFVGIGRQKRNGETLSFQDVTSPGAECRGTLHPATTQLPVPSPFIPLRSASAPSLPRSRREIPSARGAKAPKSGAEQLQPSRAPRAVVAAPSTGWRGDLPGVGTSPARELRRLIETRVKNTTTGANQQVSPFPLLGNDCFSAGHIFQNIFIMRQHGKFSLVNLIKLETNEYVML